ncbi:MAG: 6-carboxytetrahydropterin synthase, partial [Nitrosomonadales bacterium]|nr:6-carboxytetrahydropterin synthase [Nitrosomonadales bacterium]
GWDHAFLEYSGDKTVCDFLASLPNHRTVILDVVPTAENLYQAAFNILEPAYQDTYGNHLRLESVRLYETPNNWADCVRS